MKKINKLLLTLLSTTCLISLLTLIGCSDKGDNQETKKSIAGLIENFETYDEVRKIDFGTKFGAASINKDKQYVTYGNASLKVTNTRDTAKMTIPLVDEDMGKDCSDTTKLSKLKVDFYNASSENYNLSIALSYQDGLVKTDFQKVVLQPNEWTYYEWEVDIVKLSVSTDLTLATDVIIQLEPNSNKTVYIDKIMFEYLSTAPKVYDVVLDDKEFCSYEKEYQEFAMISSGYAKCDDFLPVCTINTDADYIKEGNKSLKVVCPKANVTSLRYPYVTFSPKLLDTVNLSQYGQDSAISFWIYNDSDKNFYLMIDLFRKGQTVQRQFTRMLNSGWNNIILTFSEINKVDEGVDLLTDNLGEFRLVYQSFTTVDQKVLYLDDFRILTGSELYEGLITPNGSSIYNFDDETDRAEYQSNIDKYFVANNGDVSITNEASSTGNGYSIKLTNIVEESGLYKSWVTLKLENLIMLTDYVINQEEYQDYNMLTFNMKVDASTALVCGFDGYNILGTVIQKTSVKQDWVKIAVPVKEIVNTEIQLYLSSGVNTVYFDNVQLEKSYKITWKDDKGNTLGSTYVAKDMLPYFNRDVPTKQTVNGVGYVFARWTPNIAKATANATYTAVFDTSYKPVDEEVYRFEAYDDGTDISNEFTNHTAVIDDGVTATGSGKSVKITIPKSTTWGVIYFKELLTNIQIARKFVTNPTAIQIKMHVEGEKSIVLFGDRNFTMFGKSFGDGQQKTISKTDWTTIIIGLDEISDNILYYYSSGACELYIDEIKLLDSYVVRTDYNRYDFDTYATGDNVKAEFENRNAIISEESATQGGKSVKFTLLKSSTQWGAIYFTNLNNCKVTLANSDVNYVKLVVRIKSFDNDALLKLGYVDGQLVFGTKIPTITLRATDTEWTTIYVPISEISNTNRFISYYINKDCELYIDTIEFVKTYSVKYYDGETLISEQIVENGKLASKPTTLTRQDVGNISFIFKTWQLNGVDYNFSTPITGDIILKATWTEQNDYSEEFIHGT